MARILNHARSKKHRTAAISFQLANGAICKDLSQLLRWFCVIVTKKLSLTPELTEHWLDILDDKSNCTAYFEEYLLSSISDPFTLGLDEVDRLFDEPLIAAEFLGLLRGWHELAKDSAVWSKLRLVVVHSTESYINLDVNQSPFNVGLPVRLADFTPGEIDTLSQKHGLTLNESDRHDLMELVGGHPYLIRVALYYISRQELTMHQFVDSAATDAGKYSDHLRRHLWNLLQFPQLASAMRSAIASPSPIRIPSEAAFKLESMGLVKPAGNDISITCELYRRYFDDHLKAH